MDKKKGAESKDAASEKERDTKLKDRHAPASDNASKTPKKRRKVNHGEFCPSHLLPHHFSVSRLPQCHKLMPISAFLQPVCTAADL